MTFILKLIVYAIVTILAIVGGVMLIIDLSGDSKKHNKSKKGVKGKNK